MQNVGPQFNNRPPLSDWLCADMKQFNSASSVLLVDLVWESPNRLSAGPAGPASDMGEFIFIILHFI